MVLHNPGNWHWVNKDARDWALEYFTEKLTTISAEEKGVSAQIVKVLGIEGDVDVSQRKGKIITIFDVKVRLEYNGKNADDVEASGSITVPEVAHDTEIDEYVFEISNYSDSKEKQVIRDLVRTKLTPQLREAFAKFQGDLIAEHGKDIQHAPGTGPPPLPKANIPQVSTSTEAKSAKPTATVHTQGPVVNTVTIAETYEFNTSADQMYQTFVDPQRVAAFTRAPPREFEPKEGGKFSLFGGNVEGSFKVLEKDTKIVQTWRLGDWPKGHYSTLTLVFDQGTSTTNLRLTWDGVPVGQEEVTKRNFNEYYVRSIKSTFGFGAVL
ncbi:activator of Hsp90 ATPase [Geopyxis carbonaria]|nr:activator of Hsp90 ATPase [Geopyxis carbonaria]